MQAPQHSHHVSFGQFEEMCATAVRSAGANEETVAALTRATVAAEAQRNPSVGASHLVDYLESLKAGRINPDPQPTQTSSHASVLNVDADEGVAQLAFDETFELLVDRARTQGIAVLSIRNAYSGGAFSYYVAQLAEAGLVAFACGNSAALLSVLGAASPVTGTNPHAFALPHPLGPRMFDQASSETAWVNIRSAAERGDPIPAGWAVDKQGAPTTDAAAALAGAALPFGGIKGGNIALTVELLAALAGGLFSLDAAPFDSGDRSPGLGLFVLALDPAAFSSDFPERAEAHLQRLDDEYGIDFGRRHAPPEAVELDEDLYRTLTSAPAATTEDS